MLVGQFSNLVNFYVNSKLNLCYGAYSVAGVAKSLPHARKMQLPHQIKMPKQLDFFLLSLILGVEVYCEWHKHPK